MKKLFKVVTIFVLALIYCLEIGNAYNYSTPYKTTSQKTDTYVASVSLNLLGSNSNSENLLASFNSCLSTPFKDFLISYKAKIRATQLIFAKEFIQYTNFSKNFQILFRKTDLIFPFNYFW